MVSAHHTVNPVSDLGWTGLRVPAGWLPIDLEVQGLSAWTGPVAGSFASNLVLTCGPAPTGMTPDDWQAESLRLLQQNPTFRLLDAMPTVVRGGHLATRRLGVHAQQGQSLTMVQWAWLDDAGRALTVTGTCRTCDIDGVHDTFCEAVEEADA